MEKRIKPSEAQNLPVTNSSPQESFKSLSSLVQDLQTLQPLRHSSQQRQLARQALAALSNRKDQNIQEWANKLAADVGDDVD